MLSKKENGIVSLNYLKNLKKIFFPVVHILAAMDVIACRAYLPVLPPDLSFLPHHPDKAETDNALRAGRTLMDYPHDDTMTIATLGYALWFQQWGLEKSVRGGRKLLSPDKIVKLQSDLPLPMVSGEHWIVEISDDQIVLEEPLENRRYTVREPYADTIFPKTKRLDALRRTDMSTFIPCSGEEPAADSVNSNNTAPAEDDSRTRPAMLMLPPLSDDIIAACRSFTDERMSRGNIVSS